MARYKRSHAEAGVSLECDTEHVPGDGRYHLLQGSQVVSSHKSLKAGTAAYLKLVEDLGFSTKATPLPAPTDSADGSSGVSPRLIGDYYVYGKSRRRKTGTRTYG